MFTTFHLKPKTTVNNHGKIKVSLPYGKPFLIQNMYI